MAQTYTVNQFDSQGRLRSQSVIPLERPNLKPLPSAKPPSWPTPERQDYLVKLWVKYGNQCLLGHTACPIREHYLHDYGKGVLVPQAESVPCMDGAMNPVKDAHGNPLYITVYRLTKDILHDKRIREVVTEDGITHLFGLYDLKAEAIIKEWIAEDRAQRQAEWQAEYEARHSDSDRQDVSGSILRWYHGQLHGKLNPISQEIFSDSQPQYYLENLGISGLTFRPYAKVRLASSLICLHIDIGDWLRPLSKNGKRKAVRYGKIPLSIDNRIKDACWQAVKAYLNE